MIIHWFINAFCHTGQPDRFARCIQHAGSIIFEGFQRCWVSLLEVASVELAGEVRTSAIGDPIPSVRDLLHETSIGELG